MNTPVVSVVMPAKNAAEHICEAIQSILAQDLQDLEIIVVDDGSTDGTASIVAGFADSRLRLVQGEARGVSAARNLGVRLARSPNIALMDADDRSRYDRLSKQIEMLLRLDLDAVGSSYEAIDERGCSLGVHPHLTAPSDIGLAAYAFNPVAGASLALRKDAWNSVGGLRSDIVLGEDYDLVTRLLASGFRVGAHPDPLYLYRWHSGSTSAHRRVELQAAMQDIRHSYWLSSPPSRSLAMSFLRDAEDDMSSATIRLRASTAVQVGFALARKRRPLLAMALVVSAFIRHPSAFGRQAVSSFRRRRRLPLW